MSNWTEERVARLKSLQAEGLSASRIAAALGGFENLADGGRSAVIGKLHRLGVAGLPRQARKPRARRVPRETQRAVAIKAAAYEEPADEPEEINDDGDRRFGEPTEFDLAIPLGQRKSVTELEDDTCRFPVGDPREPGFFFCGGVALDGFPYCGPHCRVAYDAAATRKPRRPYQDRKG